MKFIRLLAVMGPVVGLCASDSAARAATLEEFNVSGWIVGAYADNRTGQFTHCATSIPYRSGTTLLFHLSRGYQWSMGLHNPQWRSSPGATINLMYYIDNGPPTRVRAVVNHLGVVSIPLADSRALFETFRRGRRLFIVDSRERFGFDLSNSSRALSAVYACVQRHSIGQGPPEYDRGPPPGYDRGPPGPAPPPPPIRPQDRSKGGAETSL
jgi:hypothetical protein